MRTRITKLEQLMKHAEVAAMRSHDEETQVGCVLVDGDKHTPLGSACNGFATGVCDSKLPTTRPDKYKYIIHSEMNMLAACARNGNKTNGNYLVCTHSPCVNCMRVIYQSGIKEVIVREKYRDFSELKCMLDLRIDEYTTPEGYTRLTYSPKLKRIVVLGSNPGTRSPDLSAFHEDTQSGSRTRSWFKDLKAEVIYMNLVDEKTLLNRPLTKKEILEAVISLNLKLDSIQPDLVVAVGNAATTAVAEIKFAYTSMPHPSNLNRFWNDEDASVRVVEGLRNLINLV